jgi:hypothetical protein
MLRLHVLPVLGRRRLHEVHRRDVKALLNAKRANGYTPNGVRLMKAALSSMLTDAVDDELIEANPALQVGRQETARRLGHARRSRACDQAHDLGAAHAPP